MTDAQHFLLQTHVPGDVAAARFAEISALLLSQSAHLRGPNFQAIAANDLRLLFDAYDERFFEGRCRELLGSQPLRFLISKRMTRNGAKTTRLRSAVGDTRFEIAASATLLFDSFRTPGETAVVNGLVCQHRLDGLMRMMEHEMVHLLEMLVWEDSSCKRQRFQGIAGRFFGHLEHTHRLQTRRQRAEREFGIRPGMLVTFRDGPQVRTGLVNRITKRATVLVPDPRGEKYSDGQYYVKYYVPLQLLAPAQNAAEAG